MIDTLCILFYDSFVAVPARSDMQRDVLVCWIMYDCCAGVEVNLQSCPETASESVAASFRRLTQLPNIL